ncbi:MAG: hypothetical protein KA072_00055 [Thermoanaerobaculaceae bacterium]|nr:hypothetical protein [Thermoanaerobaculaceae bacterium]MDI9621357.1 hypothetical protein [Acidobacteriota bacterium]NLH11722.1 hypothetical protein [Holophagae bacterium]HPW54111.1 hypothetical protein [Thermoanaerobaculaceae bacterium]
MRRFFIVSALLAAVVAGAEEITVNSILSAHKMGAPVDGILATVQNPLNTINMGLGDLATLRNAGVPEAVVAALQARIPAPTPTPVPLHPDDPRLVDLVKLIKSGLSESIVAEQLKQSGQSYNLSVNDLLYLKQNGVQESIIGALMASARPGVQTGPATVTAPVAGAPATPPEELAYDGLVLQKATFLRKNRPGKLILRGESLSWVDGTDPRENFEFQIGGLEKVWMTCQARTPENFCYQISFQIVKGARYKFQDMGRETGSNAAVLKLQEGLRTYFPQLPFGAPDIEK